MRVTPGVEFVERSTEDVLAEALAVVVGHTRRTFSNEVGLARSGGLTLEMSASRAARTLNVLRRANHRRRVQGVGCCDRHRAAGTWLSPP